MTVLRDPCAFLDGIIIVKHFAHKSIYNVSPQCYKIGMDRLIDWVKQQQPISKHKLWGVNAVKGGRSVSDYYW